MLVNSPLQPERGSRPEKYHLFAPRVGVAYRLTDNTVLRAGGGIYYVPSTVNFPEGPTAGGRELHREQQHPDQRRQQ